MAKMEPTFDFVSYFTVGQFFSYRFRMGAMKKLSRWEHQAGSHMELVCATTPGVSPSRFIHCGPCTQPLRAAPPGDCSTHRSYLQCLLRVVLSRKPHRQC